MHCLCAGAVKRWPRLAACSIMALVLLRFILRLIQADGSVSKSMPACSAWLLYLDLHLSLTQHVASVLPGCWCSHLLAIASMATLNVIADDTPLCVTPCSDWMRSREQHPPCHAQSARECQKVCGSSRTHGPTPHPSAIRSIRSWSKVSQALVKHLKQCLPLCHCLFLLVCTPLWPFCTRIFFFENHAVRCEIEFHE